jgi:DNA-binding transcriptional ArsR family regulator
LTKLLKYVNVWLSYYFIGLSDIMDHLPEVLKALSDETRFKIVNLLLTHDYCVSALALHLGISEAAVSQHLQILRKSGLAKGEKRSYWTHYSIDRDKLRQVADELDAMAGQHIQPQHICPRESLSGQSDTEGRDKDMCKCDCKCTHPEKLKGKPGECSPEQIKECHGDTKEHPCAQEKE